MCVCLGSFCLGFFFCEDTEQSYLFLFFMEWEEDYGYFLYLLDDLL